MGGIPIEDKAGNMSQVILGGGHMGGITVKGRSWKHVTNSFD